QGVLFVVDGNSAGTDKRKHQEHAKPGLVKLRGPLKEGTLTNDVAKIPKRQTRQRSLGFRVMADSTVDLAGAQAAQLFAMGRGKATKARPDGKQAVGVGIARILGSRAAEVAGYEKVVISARSKGEAGDADGVTGGRVELAGQTIAIGGMNLADTDADGNELGPRDFFDTGDAKHPHLGIAPFALDELAGLEHVLDDGDDDPGLMDKALAKIKTPEPPDPDDDPSDDFLHMDMYCWPEKLRKEHPQTQRIYQHALKEVVTLAGPYMVGAVSDKGVWLGQRKASEDPFLNELDPKAPRFEVMEKEVLVTLPNADEDGAMMSLTKDTIMMAVGAEAQSEGGIAMTEGTVVVKAGDSTVTTDKSAGVEVDAPEVAVSSKGQIKIKGQTVYIN
ncbi:MAG: hypothetical protein R3266_11350, partial [Gemmatimonadota bacterium]|nr:hypothetical protein [Gemmatimonadota bacterium]